MRSGTWLLIAAALSMLCVHIIRGRFVQPAPDYLLGIDQGGRLVELGRGFCPTGVHQISDGPRGVSAKVLTACDPRQQISLKTLENVSLKSGELIEIIKDNGNPARVERSWMPAARRLSLGIPLHPDQMTLADWSDLPGIGAVTAAQIMAERQKNGDFVEFEQLHRVSGLGARRIGQIRKFFVPD